VAAVASEAASAWEEAAGMASEVEEAPAWEEVADLASEAGRANQSILFCVLIGTLYCRAELLKPALQTRVQIHPWRR
jgi:hypothetical protein